MPYEAEYWRGHYPTKEEALQVIECCDSADCIRCPYNVVGCGHFDITKVKSQVLKEFAEENKNLKEAYKELQEEFTRYIKGGKYEI